MVSRCRFSEEDPYWGRALHEDVCNNQWGEQKVHGEWERKGRGWGMG